MQTGLILEERRQQLAIAFDPEELQEENGYEETPLHHFFYDTLNKIEVTSYHPPYTEIPVVQPDPGVFTVDGGPAILFSHASNTLPTHRNREIFRHGREVLPENYSFKGREDLAPEDIGRIIREKSPFREYVDFTFKDQRIGLETYEERYSYREGNGCELVIHTLDTEDDPRKKTFDNAEDLAEQAEEELKAYLAERNY